VKLLFIIDHFGSGGAQRQMVNLACGLQGRGHLVEFFIYYPGHDFFRPIVDNAGIKVHSVKKGDGFSWKVVSGLLGVLAGGRFDAMVSFLGSPNAYAEIARAIHPRVRLIVSERNSRLADGSRAGALARRLLHFIADGVVTNSRSHAEWLRRYPWLRDKVLVVHNGYPVPAQIDGNCPERGECLRLLAVGRITEQKNPIGLIRGLVCYYERHGYVPAVSWAGRRDVGSDYVRRVDEALEENEEVKARWSWLGERQDIDRLLASHHALILPSFYEGLPNVVCEALLAGRPVLASSVCDNAELVREGDRGFLFDPNSPDSLADAFEKMAALGCGAWVNMAANARAYGVEYLGIEQMLDGYEALLQRLDQDGRLS